MTQARSISALMITHKFREFTAYCDRVTVLRRGKMADTGSVREVTTKTMAHAARGAAEKRRRGPHERRRDLALRTFDRAPVMLHRGM
ncbi:hypothetical protein [Variovorax humicola]|uniref:hypothetical protein n=1 Tax=Variovorax humicola TaxID=1769758 RepID=UPI003BF49546